MISNHTVGIVFALCLSSVIARDIQPQTAPTYGDVNVLRVLRMDEHVRIYCDLADMPDVIGKNIPVCINALKSAENPKDNLKLLMYLNDLLLSKNNKPRVTLTNVRRGEQFCLIADVHINDVDLCDLIVKQGLAHKVIEISQQSHQVNGNMQNSGNGPAHTNDSSGSGNYIASKTSKVFHWASCSHAKRMDTAKATYFVNPDDAAKTGRRPCKTCKPQ